MATLREQIATNMLRVTRFRDLIKQGLTLEQIKATSPTRGYTRRYGSDTGPWTTNQFVEAVYRSLAQKPQ